MHEIVPQDVPVARWQRPAWADRTRLDGECVDHSHSVEGLLAVEDAYVESPRDLDLTLTVQDQLVVEDSQVQVRRGEVHVVIDGDVWLTVDQARWLVAALQRVVSRVEDCEALR